MTDELAYTSIEIRSTLPTGWSVSPGSPGTWDSRRGTWSIELLDGSDLSWSVRVRKSDADVLGKQEALRRATDRAVRRTTR
jgi:hypothetical protein